MTSNLLDKIISLLFKYLCKTIEFHQNRGSTLITFIMTSNYYFSLILGESARTYVKGLSTHYGWNDPKTIVTYVRAD